MPAELDDPYVSAAASRGRRPGQCQGRRTPTTMDTHMRRPGDWMCPSCQNHNFASRVQCYRCHGAKPGSNPGLPLAAHPRWGGSTAPAAPPGGAALPGDARPGDWMCPCGNHNYASRVQCYRCGLAKAMAQQGGVGAATVIAATGGGQLHHHHHQHHQYHGGGHGGGGGGMHSGMRPGDWVCNVCNNHNYASKTACNRCQTVKGLAWSAGAKELRAGDWLCQGCSNVNYASRQSCNKCAGPKMAQSEMISASLLGMGGFPGGRNVRQGDWLCPDCGNHNFASRTACNTCSVPKPPAVDGAAEGGSGGGDGAGGAVVWAPQQRPGDWVCGRESCRNVNYAFREVCNKCNDEKPVAAVVAESPGVDVAAAKHNGSDGGAMMVLPPDARRPACGGASDGGGDGERLEEVVSEPPPPQTGTPLGGMDTGE